MNFIGRSFLGALAVCAVCMQGADTQAALIQNNWNGSTSNDYNDATNWDEGVVPDNAGSAPDTTAAVIRGAGTAVTLDAGSPVQQSLRVGGDSSLTINAGGISQSQGFAFVGGQAQNILAGMTGTVNVNTGGLLESITGKMVVGGNSGNGVLNVNGGNVVSANTFCLGCLNANVDGEVHLDSGMISAGGFETGNNAGPGTLSLDITGGTMKLTGDLTGYIAARLSFITGYGGAGTVVTSYDQSSDITTVSAVIPEPASIVMFGIAGALLVCRRR